MRGIRTIKLIKSKLHKKLASRTLKNNDNIADLVLAIGQDPAFKAYSLVFQTIVVVGGLTVSITVRDKDRPATKEQFEKLSNKLDQQSNEFDNITVEELLESQDLIDLIADKIVKSFKNKGLVLQEGELPTNIIEVNTTSSPLEQENVLLKQSLHNFQVGSVISIGVVLLAFFLLRPAKALEMLENLTNDN